MKKMIGIFALITCAAHAMLDEKNTQQAVQQSSELQKVIAMAKEREQTRPADMSDGEKLWEGLAYNNFAEAIVESEARKLSKS